MLCKQFRLAVALAAGVSIWTMSLPAQNLDYSVGRSPASTIYPTQASVMAQITLQVKSVINTSPQPIQSCAVTGGSTETDVSDSEWGIVAELAAWWYYNNGSASGFASLTANGQPTVTQASYQAFAQAELNYPLGATGANPCDISDAGLTPGSTLAPYITKASGYYYSKYTSTDTTAGTPMSDGDYFATALSLAYKDIMYQYNCTPGEACLYTATQMASLMTLAQSNWNWLTQDVEYNPESDSNQVMMTILGGYWLGFNTATDTAQYGTSAKSNGLALMSAAINYYDGGLTGSNLPPPNGYRQTDINTNPQGYSYFVEDYYCVFPSGSSTRVPPCTGGTVQGDGFDTHYSGFQVEQMTQMIYMMNLGSSTYANLCTTNVGTSCYDPKVYSDALAEMQYTRDRLSAAGTMHGGTRHNEIAGSSTDISFGASYNFFGAILNADLGRATTGNDNSTGSGGAVNWGHRFVEPFFLYLNWQPWVTTPLLVNDIAGFRRGSVSVSFDYGNQPQEIAVDGTVLTDAIHGSTSGSNGINGKAQGLEIISTSGTVTTPAVMNTPSYSSTVNFTLRKVLGTATVPGGTANVTQYYITDGTSLYIVSSVLFPTGTSALGSVSSLLGVPNVSAENRLVDIYNTSSPASIVLDLSAGLTGTDSGSYTSTTGIQTGDVRLYVWPEIAAENAAVTAGGFTWMSPGPEATYPASYLYTLEQMSDAATAVYYYPTRGNNVITNSSDIRTVMQPVTGPTSYVSGTKIASVVRIAPSTLANTMTVTANYASGSTYNLTSCVTSPCLDMEDGTTTSGPSFKLNSAGVWNFTDKATGQTIAP